MKSLEDREIQNYNFELVYSEYQTYLASQNQTPYEKVPHPSLSPKPVSNFFAHLVLLGNLS